MTEEEIKEYLKRFDELELKLTDEDKDTYQWLLFGYNECARLLNEKEQENKQLKDNWNELTKWVIEQEQKAWDEVSSTFGYVLNKMQELEQGKDE
ncbi:MAG: hypothetical protein PUJ92_06150 [Bacilli bacterium]|nr:hypothetical protein [Bacilli bacterium]MDY5832052.1 hypothetical protein [Candidatus Onthovivens sp.]